MKFYWIWRRPRALADMQAWGKCDDTAHMDSGYCLDRYSEVDYGG